MTTRSALAALSTDALAALAAAHADRAVRARRVDPLGGKRADRLPRWLLVEIVLNGERIAQVDGVASHVRATGSQSTQAHR